MGFRNVVIFLALLYGFLFIGMLGNELDESSQDQFYLWLMALAIIVTTAGAKFLYSRPAAKPASGDDAQGGVEFVEAKAKTHVSTGRSRTLLSRIVAVAIFSLLFSWSALIYLGTLTDDERALQVPFVNLQMVTAVITTAATLFLARLGPTIDRARVGALRGTAIGMLGLAIVGIILVPLIAVRIWFGYIDFPKYASEISLAWAYLTLIGVLVCFFRSRNRA